MFSPRSPRHGEIALGEGPYNILRLYCPFCGAAETAGCRHRLFAADLDGIRQIRPALERRIRQAHGLQPLESVTEEPVPSRLRGAFRDWAEVAAETLRELGAMLPDGPGSVVFQVSAPRRLDRRAVGFASDALLRLLDDTH